MKKRYPETVGESLTKYEMSAIIGLYRMGNHETIISVFIPCEVWQVTQTIRAYFLSK